MRLGNIKIGIKLIGVIVIALIGTAAVAPFALNAMRSQMMEDRQDKVQRLVEVLNGLVEHYYAQQTSGALDQAGAQKATLDAIAALRFGNNDYFFVLSNDGVSISNARKDLIGKNLSELKDATGRQYIPDLIRNGQKPGGGFTAYFWSKAADQPPAPKLSYSRAFAPWGWVFGTGISIDDVDTQFWQKAITLLEIFAAVTIGVLVLGWAAARSIAGPVVAMTGLMERLAAGNKTIEIPFTERGDEVGALARSLVVFKENAIEVDRLAAEQADAERRSREERRQALVGLAGTFEATVGGIVQAVAAASGQMESTARVMTETVREAGRQAAAVSAGATEASVNVTTVATATEELTASIGEIARQATNSSRVAGEAVSQAHETNQKVAMLSDAAKKIGEVVSLIQQIATQTNLLALNATIEAARAGEAGKGFAVVAGEVKNLAKQTATATEEIGSQIASIQVATEATVQAIRHIGETIEEVSGIAGAIAAAVEQQGAATREISRNVQQASQGTEDVSRNIAGVTQGSELVGASAQQVLGAAGELNRQSERLTAELGSFLATVRAA